METKKNVLVLPGSNWQVELVKKIKSMGHNVFVVNPFENSPCFKFSDGHLQSDIFDIDKVFEYCAENKIDSIISDECDIAMPLVAEIGEKFSFSSIDKESAKLYTDKFLMREFCRKNGIKYPEYKLCKTVDDALELFNEIKVPLIIKPLDSNASKGVYKVETKEDICKHFEETLSFSRSRKYVLAERYITGTEFTIDGIKTPSNHYTLAISEKKHFKHNANIASELFFSHDNDNFDYDKLRKVNDSFVMNSNLLFGFTHAEYKFENNEFYLIEIAARGGGNKISSVIAPFLSGHDTYKYLVDCSLGNIYDADFSVPPKHKKRTAILKFFKTPNGGGIVKEIKGLNVLETEKDVFEYMLNFNIGDKIHDAVSDSARIGFYIVCSENKEKMLEVIKKVENNFDIILEK